MEYEELIDYIMINCKGVDFKEFDNAIADLDDGRTIKIIDDENSIFLITKIIVDNNFETGEVKCRYKLQRVLH